MLEGGSRKPTNNTVLSPVVIQNDAFAVPNTMKLNGSNYPLWSKVLEMHIVGRGRKGFVTGSIKEPAEDSAEYETWEIGNAIIKGWLINSMEPAIKGFLFTRVKSFRLRQEGRPVGVYYADLKSVWQELDQRRPIKMECVADLKTLREEIQIDRVYALLAGLDDIFDKFPEFKKKLHAKELGAAGSNGGLASLAAVTPTAQEARDSSGDPNQILLTRTTLGDSSSNTGWILDSGATDHMTYDKNMFQYMTMSHRKSIATANGTLVPDIQTNEIIGRDTKREGLYYVDDVVLGMANAVRVSHDRGDTISNNTSTEPASESVSAENVEVHAEHQEVPVEEPNTPAEEPNTQETAKLTSEQPRQCSAEPSTQWQQSHAESANVAARQNRGVPPDRFSLEGKVKYPIANYVSCSVLAPECQTLVNNMESIKIPTRVEEALKDPKWAKAMDEEILPRNFLSGCQDEYEVRVLISSAANLDWPLKQFDVKNAFLHGNLEEEVYMDFPPGYSASGNTGVYPSYEKEWVLQSYSDHTLFVKRRQDKVTALIIYVDNMIITGDDHDEILKLQNNLAAEFEMKNLGDLKYFLGVEVAHSSKGIFLSQCKYVLDLLKESGMLGCKPVDTPIVEKHHLCLDPNQKSVDKGRYQRLVGRLIYLAHTRPDIAYAKVVSRSSAEAEYRGMAHGICEILWLRKLLWSLGFKTNETVKLYCDNKSARDIADNPVQHDRTKHVKVDRHFIKEKLEKKIVSIPFVKSDE
ncbi:uncharacterized protein [Malus domestica]|uniref:uncharacterized protein n=1 Tax=Malus domestica TaxID=3750 RepID=UPI003975195F